MTYNAFGDCDSDDEFVVSHILKYLTPDKLASCIGYNNMCADHDIRKHAFEIDMNILGDLVMRCIYVVNNAIKYYKRTKGPIIKEYKRYIDISIQCDERVKILNMSNNILTMTCSVNNRCLFFLIDTIKRHSNDDFTFCIDDNINNLKTYNHVFRVEHERDTMRSTKYLGNDIYLDDNNYMYHFETEFRIDAKRNIMFNGNKIVYEYKLVLIRY